MNKPLTAVVVGTGFIGPVHVEALRRAGVVVRGIVGSSPEKSQQAADQLGLPRAYDSLEKVLADAAVSVVHLTTPNRFHFAQASAVLKAGKHVMCEKPLAMNSLQTGELLKIAAQAGKAAGVCYNVRFYPLCQEAAARVRSGEVGDIYHVTGSYAQDWLFHPTDFNWRVMAEAGGELRAVADIGTHWLDLMQFITGQEVEAVFADLKTIIPERQRPVGNVETFSSKLAAAQPTAPVKILTEDYGNILLHFSNGTRGSVWVSQVNAGRKNCLRFEVAGSKRALSFDSERPNELWIGHRDRPNEQLIRDPALLSPQAREYAQYPGGHNEGFPDTFKQLFREFYRYIDTGDFTAPANFPTFADGHREVRLCEAILRSHREQSWIQI